MKKNRIFKENSRGQILVMAIFVFVIIFIFAFLVIETGNLIYKKIHIQNACDSAALEGGIWYARILNIVAITNKILAGTYVATFLSFGILKNSIDMVQIIQDWIINLSPYFICGAVLLNGHQNKLLSIPLFNKEAGENSINNSLSDFSFSKITSLFPDIINNINIENEVFNKIKEFANLNMDGDYSIIPNLNLKRQTAASILTTEVRYYYKENNVKKYVDANNVSYNHKAKRWQIINPIQTKNGPRRYFVTREVVNKYNFNADENNPLKAFIEEKGPHYIWVGSVKTGNEFLIVKNLFKDEKKKKIESNKFFITMSKVVVDGGSMDVHDLNGANYSPKFERAGLPVNIGNFDEKFLSKFLLH